MKVRAVSRTELKRVERTAENLFARAARRSMEAAIRQFKLTPETLTADGSVEDAIAASTTWEAQVAALMPIIDESWHVAANGIITRLSNRFVVPSILDTYAADHLAIAQNRIARFGNEAWRVVRNDLVAGFQSGESIDEIAARVRLSSALTEQRARVVARTEIISASNAGSYIGAQVLPEEVQPKSKEWLATEDDRTRESHLDASGQRVPLTDNFDVGGDALEYPGDPNGDPAEIINCRCTMLYDTEAA